MPKSRAKLQPWQIFHASYKALGMQVMMAIWGKSHNRIIYAYGQDPAVTEKRVRNPIEKLREMFAELALIGRGSVARAAIDYLQAALDDDCEPAEIAGLQSTIEAEILRDYSAVGKLQELIEAGADPAAVRQALSGRPG
jgi:hypothetical protein